MVRSVANLGYKAIGLGLVGAILLKFIFIIRPTPLPPPPAGWTIWQEPGPIRALVIIPDGVYAGGSRGLFLLKEGGTSIAIGIPGTKGTIFVNTLLLDRNSTLWVGHDQGLSIRTGSEWKTLSEADGLPHRWIESIAATKNGIVWLGTAKGAVRMRDKAPWNQSTISTLTTQDGLLHNTVWPIVEDNEGGLWFGNYRAPAGGLSRLKNGQWRYWTPKEGLPHPNVTSLMLDSEGRLWAGCGLYNRGGAAIFSKAAGGWNLERTIPEDDLTGSIVRSLYQDRRGQIWLGSENEGLTIRKGDKTIRILTPVDGLPAGEIMAMAEADDGTMWLGTQAGAVRIAPEAVVSLLAEGPGAEEKEAP